MEIRVKQASLVVPAKETTNHRLWISNLDLLLLHRGYVPLVYFYRPASDRAHFFEACVLKEALSEALVAFYPVAGRLARDENGRLEIDCNAKGVLFVEAETSCAIDDEFGPDDFSPSLKMEQLVPSIDLSTDLSSSPLLAIQVTYFTCGGVCLGIGWHHILGDGNSGFHFINSWAEVSRGFSISIRPIIDRTILQVKSPPYPTFDHVEFHPPPSLNIKELQSRSLPVTVARLKLSLDQINALKAEFKKDHNATYSTFEILAAQIWRCTCLALGLSNDQETKLQMPTNGRSRLNPPLPYEYFGNVIFPTASISLAGDIESKPLINTVKIIHEAIERVDEKYSKSSLAYVAQLDQAQMAIKTVGSFNRPNQRVVSWLGMPIYNADFGWGNPIYVTRATFRPERISYILPSPPNEKSVTIIISLEVNYMQIFKKFFYSLEAGPLKYYKPSSL